MKKSIHIIMMLSMSPIAFAQVGSDFIYLKNTGSSINFTSGWEAKFLWYPSKYAFRAGRYSWNSSSADLFGSYSFAFGSNARAQGSNSFAFGDSALSTGNSGIAFGEYSWSGGYASTAIGMSAMANDYGSVSIGYDTWASNSSIAIGIYAYASGGGSIAIGGGYVTHAGSVAIGRSGESNAMDAYAMGWGALVRSRNGFAVGTFNHPISTSNDDNSNSRPLFMVGNGTGWSLSERSNAFAVLANGTVIIDKIQPSGDIPMGGFQ